jgi:glucose/arabinose dehydrogenase
VAALAFAGACDSRPAGLRVPGAIAHTPLALVAGTAGLPTSVATSTPELVPTRLVPPPEPLELPADFYAGVFADGTGPVRALARAPNGDVFATVPRFNQILVLPDRDGDGVADQMTLYHEGAGLHQPVGLAVRDGELVVANTDGLVRFAYQPGDLQPRGPPETLLSLPGGGLHWARSLELGPDGELYVGIGSTCDACVESEARRAILMRVDRDGGVLAHAIGLREAGGLAFQPLTGGLWATDSGRSGDDVPSELNQVTAGADFGWPRCLGDRLPDRSVGGDPDACQLTVGPAVPLQPRSEPLGITFAETERLPGTWRDDLFVAFRGSSDTGLPVGYKVGRVAFEGGVPTGEVFDFVTGWLRPDTRRWGRPVDLLTAADGALLIADEGGERIYRVHYDPPTPTPTPFF